MPKVGQIHVGGNTEMEAEERKHLIDDAVATTETLWRTESSQVVVQPMLNCQNSSQATQTVQTYYEKALLSPFKVLMTNSGERYGVKLDELKEFGKGFDVLGDSELVDLKEHGIIDPVLVIRQAIPMQCPWLGLPWLVVFW